MKKSNARLGHRIAAVILCIVVCLGSVCPNGVVKAANEPVNANIVFGIPYSNLSVWNDGMLGMTFLFSYGIPEAYQKGYVLVDGVKYPFQYFEEMNMYGITRYMAPKDIYNVCNLSVHYNNQTCLLYTDTSGHTATGISCAAIDLLNQYQQMTGKEADLAKAIDDYGTSAKIYFDNNPAESAISFDDVNLNSFAPKLSGSLPNGVSYYGSCLFLDESITIRHYFKIFRQPSESLRYFVAGKEVTPGTENGLFYVDVPNVLAWEIDQPTNITVTCSGKVFSLDYSVLSYAYDAMEQSSSGKLCSLVKSIYRFYSVIKSYTDPDMPISGDPVTLEYMNSKFTDDMPEALIVIPANATDEEKYAAKLLQSYIYKEQKSMPQISNDSNPISGTKYEISVGNTNRYHGTAKYSSNDSYSIKSYQNPQKGVSITGIGELGLMHGAMRFLEACGGYFYMSWDDSYVTYQDTFKVDLNNGIDIDYERAFVFTDIDVNYSKGGSDFPNPDCSLFKLTNETGYPTLKTGRMYSLSMGLNGFFSNQRTYGGDVGGESWYLTAVKTKGKVYTEPENVNGLAAGHAHTLLAEYLPASKYFVAHPDWYCTAKYPWELSEMDSKGNVLPDNQRERSGEQLCLYNALHNETTYKLILQHCQDIIDSSYDPDANMQIISLTQNDGAKFCSCSKCRADRAAHHASWDAESVEMILLLNQLAKDLDIANRYPNLYLDTFAYTWTIKSPGDVVCDDHIIVRFAPIMGCYGHALNDTSDERCKEYLSFLKEWLKCCKHVWIWDYDANFQTTIAPYSNIDIMQQNINLYKELGVEGVYLQSNYEHSQCNTEFGDIRNYILARLLQDPDRDYQKELEFFTDAYYGSCGVYVREYLARMEKQAANHHHINDKRDKETCYDSLMYETYGGVRSFNAEYNVKDTEYRMPYSEIGACEGLWRTIKEVSKNESVSVQKRLHNLEFSWRLVKSTLNVYEFSNQQTYASENTKLRDDMKNAGVTRFGFIGNLSMEKAVYMSNHPDNWCNKDDIMVGSFLTKYPNVNLNPTIIYPNDAGNLNNDDQDDGEKMTAEKLMSLKPQEPVSMAKSSHVYSGTICYNDMGAKGDGITNDYEAIVATHAYANKNNLKVVADSNSTYYLRIPASATDDGAVIMTDTDWTGAHFIIDDSYLVGGDATIKKYIFSIMPSKSRVIGSGSYYRDAKGVVVWTGSTAILNKISTLKAGQENVDATFDTDYYIVAFDHLKPMHLRTGTSSGNTSGKVGMEDVFVLHADGTIDPNTPVQWDFPEFTQYYAYPIDKELLTVKGGTFTTIVNQANVDTAVYHSIAVKRCNVLIEGVEHYLDKSKVEDDNKIAPSNGFIYTYNCAFVTIKDCVLSNHYKAKIVNEKGTFDTAPYDLHFESTCCLYLDHVTECTDIYNKINWPIIGSNYVKDFRVENSYLSNIDIHKSCWNITVKDTTLGWGGIGLTGGGLLYMENVDASGKDFIYLRKDFGSDWNGNIVIKNCAWHPRAEIYYPYIIFVDNRGTDYGYICHLPNVYIDGFTVYDECIENAAYKRLGVCVYSPIDPTKNEDVYAANPTWGDIPMVNSDVVVVKNYVSKKGYSLFLTKEEHMYRVKDIEFIYEK